MPANGLDGLLIEMSRVTEDAAGDVVCVLQALKNVGGDRELRALSQLHAVVLCLCVDALNPLVVVLCVLVLDVLLEDNHVVVLDLLGLSGGQDRSSVVVDGANLQHGRGCGKCRQHGVGVLHDGWVSRAASARN